MALPIAPTPVLYGEDAANFFKTVYDDLKKPVGPVLTPKLGQALKLIRQHAAEKQKLSAVR